MKQPVFVSFYTPDYAGQAERLLASITHLGLRACVSMRPDTGRWVSNCAQKPRFIWEMMAKYHDRPVVWTDADSVIRQRPELFFGMIQEDIGVCRYKWNGGSSETFSGTVYFNPTEAARKVVDRWIEQQTLSPDQWDQVSLAKAIQEVHGVRVFSLPVSYCFIYDLHRRAHPEARPIIEHFQHSRETRAKKP